MENLSCLHKMCNLTTTWNIYNQTRPSYILRSGDMAFKVTNTFKNYYINPFNPFLGKKTLDSLSSGAAMPAKATDYLLLLHEKGKDLCKYFLSSRTVTTTKRCRDRIARNMTKCFWQKKLVAPACSNKETNNIDIAKMFFVRSFRTY